MPSFHLLPTHRNNLTNLVAELHSDFSTGIAGNLLPSSGLISSDTRARSKSGKRPPYTLTTS